MKILYIGNKLAKHGKSPTTIDTLGIKLENMGYQVYYASDKQSKISRMLDMLLSTYRLRKKVDVVCIDTYSFQNFYYALAVSALCRLFRIKYIPFLHGGKLPFRLDHSPRLSKFIFKNSYSNVSPSGFLQFEFKKRGYSAQIIPNSINISQYTFKKRAVIKPNLLFVRHFASIYNPQMAIRVLKKLQSIYPEATLNFVGEDKDGTLHECKKLANELEVINSIVFSGRLTQQEWHKLSDRYDVFINTTTVDNTPVSLIEAMALGLPVVSTNVGGIPFMVESGTNALLVKSNDEDHMVKSILSLIEDSNLVDALTTNGRWLSESYNWDAVKMQWEKFFKKLAH